MAVQDLLSIKAVVVLILLLSFLAWHYRTLYIAPSPRSILLIQTVTLQRKIPPEVFAAYSPSIVEDCLVPSRSVFSLCALYPLLFTKDEWSRMDVGARLARIRSEGGDNLDIRRKEVLQTNTSAVVFASDVPPRLRLSAQRFSSKAHVTNQLQFYLEYPLSFMIAGALSSREATLITADAISFVGTVAGILAGVAFYMASSFDNPIIIVSNFVRHLNERAFGRADAKVAGDDDVVEQGAAGSLRWHYERPSHDQESSGDDANCQRHSMVEGPISVGGGATPQSIQVADDDGLVATVRAGAVASASYFQQKDLLLKSRLVTLGTWLFVLRNYLDTLDGVLARAQKAKAHPEEVFSPAVVPMSAGRNGQTIDMIGDTIGGTITMIGLLALINSQPVVIARIWRLVMAKLGFRQTIRQAPALPKWICFCGLLYLPLAAGLWGTMMFRYVNLFDVGADGDSRLQQLEDNPHVRFNQFLWSVSCADFYFSMLSVGLLFDCAWVVVQWYAFVGFPWLALVSLHTVVVWTWIVMPNVQLLGANALL